jgi:Rrf2 family protein
MKLTTKSEYALLALLHIARNGGTERLIPLDEICARHRIPAKYLEQLLRALARGGIVQARRGVGGGYRLAKPAAEIDVASIVRLLDGALAPSESVSRFFFAHTPLEHEPKMMRVLREIRDYISRRLEHLTLADLV